MDKPSKHRRSCEVQMCDYGAARRTSSWFPCRLREKIGQRRIDSCIRTKRWLLWRSGFQLRRTIHATTLDPSMHSGWNYMDILSFIENYHCSRFGLRDAANFVSAVFNSVVGDSRKTEHPWKFLSSTTAWEALIKDNLEAKDSLVNIGATRRWST